MKSPAELHREFDALFVGEERLSNGALPKDIKSFIDRQRIADLKERIAEVEGMKKDERCGMEEMFGYHSKECWDVCCAKIAQNKILDELLSRLRSDLSKVTPVNQ